MKLASFLLLRKLENGTGILFNPEDGKTFNLNAVAVIICSMLQEGEITLPQLLQRLNDDVEDIPSSAAADIEKFLKTLQACGYITGEIK